MKARKGTMVDFLGFAICMLMLVSLMLASVTYANILERKRTVDDYAREYLLVLETKGTLDEDDIAGLQAKLNAEGYNTYTVTFNEENVPVQYGEEVSITIDIHATAAELDIGTVGGLLEDTYDISTTLYSRAKK